MKLTEGKTKSNVKKFSSTPKQSAPPPAPTPKVVRCVSCESKHHSVRPRTITGLGKLNPLCDMCYSDELAEVMD